MIFDGVHKGGEDELSDTEKTTEDAQEQAIEDEEEVAPTNSQTNSIPTTPPPTVTPPSTIDTQAPIDIDPGVVVVTYTDSGFIPPVVEVTAGGSVTFINSSTKPLWVTSEDHPTAKAQVYRGFDQGKSMSSGGTYTFSFTQVGVWGYKNLNLEKHLGAVSVIPQ